MKALRPKRRGVALLAVLLLVVLLEVLVADLACFSALSLKSARNYASDLANTAAVDGVLRIAPGILWNESLSVAERTALIEKGIRQLQVGDVKVDVTFEDESGKLNLNLLLEGNSAREELGRLLELLGKDSGLASKIVDFVVGEKPPDSTEEAGTGISTLLELRLVEGITDEFLFGPPERERETGYFALSKYVTCWSRGPVNINTASPEVLKAILEPYPDLLHMILERRVSRHFSSISDVPGYSGLSEEQMSQLEKRLTAETDTYRLEIACGSGTSRYLAEAVLRGDSSGSSVLLFRRKR